jgi:hypothetical protein
MVAFSPNGSGGARLILDDAESELMRRLTGELRAILTSAQNADDPVVERLFPPVYEEPTDEAAYRDLIGDDLVTFKLEALDAVSTALGDRGSDVDLEGETLQTWLAALTDMRLAIGTRLEVDEETMAAEIDPDHPDARSLAVLHWLGWIQEGILRTAAGL